MPYLLGEEDRRILADMVREFLATHKTSLIRGEDGITDYLTSEVLIAQLPVGGIPPLSGDYETGTGTGSGATPGSVSCDTFRIVLGALEPAGLVKEVYNISGTTLTGDWALIVRDKYGDWLAVTAGGTSILTCTLTADLLSGESAAATLLEGPTKTTQGDSITVYDLPAFIPDGQMIESGAILRIFFDPDLSKYCLLTSNQCPVAQIGTGTASGS